MANDVRSTISGVIDYSAINREFRIPIDASRIQMLRDIQLQIYSSPATVPHPALAEFGGGEDHRLYINEFDVTSGLIRELQNSIDTLSHEIIRENYLLGVDAYLKLARRFHFPENELSEELVNSRIIADDTDWRSKLATLGDRSVGWSGNLHCFNYLYRYIPMPPVSLTRAWKHFTQTSNTKLPAELFEFDSLVVTLSQGSAPTYDDFDPALVIPHGRVVYFLESHHENPLEKPLREIATRLRTINKQMDNQRISYLNPIKNAAETATVDIESGNKETAIALNRIENAVNKL